MHASIPLDGKLQRLVCEKPGVEGRKRLHVRNLDGLANVDGRELSGRRVGEVDAGERLVRFEILEVHDAGEAVDIGVHAAIGGDGGVDGHIVRLGLGFGDDDGFDGELGIIDLALGNFGDADKDAGGSLLELRLTMMGFGPGANEGASWSQDQKEGHLHEADNQHDNADEGNQMSPPKALAVRHARPLLPTADSILALPDCVLRVGHGCRVPDAVGSKKERVRLSTEPKRRKKRSRRVGGYGKGGRFS